MFCIFFVGICRAGGGGGHSGGGRALEEDSKRRTLHSGEILLDFEVR